MQVTDTKGEGGKAISATMGPRHHFFGYYEKCPWDATGRYLLGVETGFMDRPPTPDDVATVGLIDLKDGNRWRALGQTRAWNWQQGCMLQWLGDSSHDPKYVIYNDVQDGRAVAVIQSISGGERRVLPRPIYCVSRDGKWALGLNFGRLHQARPGYGYCGADDISPGELVPQNDGVYRMDLQTGETRLILSIADIANFKHAPDMDGAFHKFNHLQLAPNGRRFSFLHRWMKMDTDNKEAFVVAASARAQLKGRAWSMMRKTVLALKSTPAAKLVQGLQERFYHPRLSYNTRMFTANHEGREVHCVASDGLATHSDWRNNTQILVWARQKDKGDRFFLFTDQTRSGEVVGEGVLTNDGHCTYSPDGRWILTDKGPNARNMSTLILFDTLTGKRSDILQVFSPPQLRGEIRCDLHPRWSRDGRQVCFDSAHEGNRQIYVLDIARWLDVTPSLRGDAEAQIRSVFMRRK